MDVGPGKRAVGGNTALRKTARRTLRDTDGAVQLCSRIGCSGRLNPLKGAQNNPLQKHKPLKPFVSSSCSKEVIGNLSKNCSSVPNSSKSLLESRKKRSSNTESISSIASSTLGEREIQEISTTAKNHTERKLKAVQTGKAIEVASSSTKIRKGYCQKPGVLSQDARIGSTDNGSKKNIANRRFTEGEKRPSARGKEIGEASSHVSDPRCSRNWVASRGSGVSSVRTRKPVNVDQNGSSSGQPINDMLQTEMHWFSSESSSSGSSLDDGHDTHRNCSLVGFTEQYSMSGIADVLLALERIEQYEELTYERLLEANPFLCGLSFYDQHRDMRLDIDNMSYEELLALEEKMGTVSTALSEDELAKCLRVSVYESLHLKEAMMKCTRGLDDTKCSICQEEFVVGDEVGNLGCAHGYHKACINEWLGHKNWCPICKASARQPAK